MKIILSPGVIDRDIGVRRETPQALFILLRKTGFCIMELMDCEILHPIGRYYLRSVNKFLNIFTNVFICYYSPR